MTGRIECLIGSRRRLEKVWRPGSRREPLPDRDSPTRSSARSDLRDHRQRQDHHVLFARLSTRVDRPRRADTGLGVETQFVATCAQVGDPS